MCGIAGHTNYEVHPDCVWISNMVNRLRHRGPDDHGLWISEKKTCVFGHSRLSVIDISSGNQPMVDHETGSCIVFNGEIYNYNLLKKECELKGYHFYTNSDTEVILALYMYYGVNCLKKLRGMFSFAIWDNRDEKLFFARDRIGKKPFVYAIVDGGILFSSEVDALASHPLLSRDIDQESIELYLQLQYIPAPWTIYKNIRKLPPAHFGLFDNCGLKIEKYWHLDYRRKARISESDALDEFEEKLYDAVRLRMIADVPLGALLSGGVDSSVLVAIMSRITGSSVRTFSIGFDEESHNELPYAQSVADICHTEHYPLVACSDVAQFLPVIVRHYGEPYADTSAVPSFMVAQEARRHVTVAMNGDGGDELMAGYPKYVFENYQMRISPVISRCISSKSAALIGPELQKSSLLPMRILRKILFEYVRPEIKSVCTHNPFFNDVLRRELLLAENKDDLLASWRTQCFVESCKYADNPVERMLMYDVMTYLPGDLLLKMDIASMHCGLETRSPLLDHELLEYCATLPAEFKVRNGTGKYLLKKLAERYFPKEFVHRRKMGFAIPLEQWLRGPLRSFMEEILRDRLLMDSFNSSVIDRILSEFTHNAGGHESRIWALLMFGIWRQQLIGCISCR